MPNVNTCIRYIAKQSAYSTYFYSLWLNIHDIYYGILLKSPINKRSSAAAVSAISATITHYLLISFISLLPSDFFDSCVQLSPYISFKLSHGILYLLQTDLKRYKLQYISSLSHVLCKNKIFF